MTETQLFVSSCSRRELARRRSHSRVGALAARIHRSSVAMTALAAVFCAAAFFAGRGGV